MTKEVGERTILCFDFGTKSIGVAVGNEITGSATALTAIKAKDGKPDQNVLDKYFKDWCPDIIVVGLPLNMDGTYQELTFRAKKFGNRLANNYKLEVCFKDERLTTTSAREHLFDNRGFKGLKKSNIDCQAAVIILEAFMNGD
ncbi:MAG: Holliday junction resolvase RuvX [Succinivibrionaceae bacterium]|nr:Holliday junction resolvase RuvX [Succinivibrionaceae bacterium]MEE1340490.1 Holliday junction resolvase RuvX [Succinivibrionaceae bacterium]